MGIPRETDFIFIDRCKSSEISRVNRLSFPFSVLVGEVGTIESICWTSDLRSGFGSVAIVGAVPLTNCSIFSVALGLGGIVVVFLAWSAVFLMAMMNLGLGVDFGVRSG